MPSRKVSADAAVDLQMHTTFSDGVWTPRELLDHVAGEGFQVIAVTDHDSPHTTAEIQRLAAEHHPSVHVLSAVEMSSSWDGELTDLLCFGFDPEDNALAPVAERTRRLQLENVRETYDALVRRGYRFPSQRDTLGGADREPQSLDDLIKLMVTHGYGDELGPAIRGAGFRWINEEPAAIVEAAHRSGAVCVIAHPGRTDGFTQFDEAMLERFRAVAPVDGLEAYYPLHTPEQTAAYLAYAEAHDLLVSAGSDAHGKPTQWPIKYRAEQSRALLERLGVAVG